MPAILADRNVCLIPISADADECNPLFESQGARRGERPYNQTASGVVRYFGRRLRG